MDEYSYVITVNRIAEIEQRQLQILDYLVTNMDNMIEQQKDNMQGLMAALKQERRELEKYLEEDNLIRL